VGLEIAADFWSHRRPTKTNEVARRRCERPGPGTEGVSSMQTHRSPPQGIAIDRQQREAVYEEVINHLTGLGDVHINIQRGDYATARRLRREFEEDLRLLDDLGWAKDQPAESFELTIPSDELARVIRRLHAYTADALHDYVLREKDDEQIAARQVAACAAYGTVLARVAELEAAAAADATAGPRKED
jgi:hypothetical protein